MKKRKTAAILLALCLSVALLCTACGDSFDPVAYTQGSLDAAFHGVYDEDYINSLDDGSTKESLEADSQEIIDEMVEDTMSELGISDSSNELSGTLGEMFKNVFNATKYEVGEATEGEEGAYDVEITIYPLLDYARICNDEDDVLTDAVLDKISLSMSDEELYTVLINELCAQVNTALENPTYGDPQTFSLHLFVNDDGYYDVDEDSMEEFAGILLGMDL